MKREERNERRIVWQIQLWCVFLFACEVYMRPTRRQKIKKYCQQGEWKENHVMFVPFSIAQSDSIFLLLLTFWSAMNEQHLEKKRTTWKTSLSHTKSTFTIFSYKIRIDTTIEENFLFFEWYRYFFFARIFICAAFKMKWNETHFFLSFGICFFFFFSCYLLLFATVLHIPCHVRRAYTIQLW